MDNNNKFHRKSKPLTYISYGTIMHFYTDTLELINSYLDITYNNNIIKVKR